MTNLLTILLILFVVLGTLVMVLEKYAKPISIDKQKRLSSLLLVLVFILLCGRLMMEILGH